MKNSSKSKFSYLFHNKCVSHRTYLIFHSHFDFRIYTNFMGNFVFHFQIWWLMNQMISKISLKIKTGSFLHIHGKHGYCTFIKKLWFSKYFMKWLILFSHLMASCIFFLRCHETPQFHFYFIIILRWKVKGIMHI